MQDIGNRLHVSGNRRIVKHIDPPRREDESWDPITNNSAPNVRYGKKMSASGGAVFQPPPQPTSSNSGNEVFKTGRKMVSQPQVKEQTPPVTTTAPPSEVSPSAYGKTARMKFSRRYEGNTNIINGEGSTNLASANSSVRTGRGAVALGQPISGNIITGEGVVSQPVRRRQQFGYVSTVGERPWALDYEGGAPQ